MVLRTATTLRSAGVSIWWRLGFSRWYHGLAQPPLNGIMSPPVSALPRPVFPETEQSSESRLNVDLPPLFLGRSMELMAVPKRKVSRHKRGIRNGPKALKPTPVIIRCRACGRVKLPHFYCCNGRSSTV